MTKHRYLKESISNDALSKGKMAFITGPRQVGKSTVAKMLIHQPENYFVYDDESFRKAWTKSPEKSLELRGEGPVVLDEIHKDRRWKTRVKGLYDKSNTELPIVVTGSARLDFFRRGADSLLGRYFAYRLHPFSVAENAKPVSPDDVHNKRHVHYGWSDLLNLTGFPEPLLRGSEREAQRWSRLRLERIALEDSRDLLNISDLNAFRAMVDLLPDRVGSLLSANSLVEDVGKAYGTIRSWLMVLDALYYTFTIKPYSKKMSRAIKAEPKLYLFDTLRIPKENLAKRQENLAALHLLKMCQFWTDTAQGEFELRFIRTKEKKEIDFAILRDNAVWMLIECKSNDRLPSKTLMEFTELLNPTYAYQLVSGDGYDRNFPALGIRVMSYEKFFSGTV